MTGTSSELQRVYDHGDQAALAWKADGGQVLGYVGRAPEALIAAAGFLPFRLRGAPDTDATTLSSHLFPVFNKAQSSRGLISRELPNTIFSQIIDRRFEFVDRLVIVADRKDVSLLFTHVRAAASAGADVPPSYFLDRVPAGGFAGSEFNRASLLRLKIMLEQWSGRVVTDEALSKAIHDWNGARTALDRVVRHRQTGGFTGREGLVVLGAADQMPKGDYPAFVDAALAQAQGRAVGRQIAIFGSPIDHDRFHAIADKLGAHAVYDGHEWGEAGLAPLMSEDLPPFEAIVEQFNRTPVSPLVPLANTAAKLAAASRSAGADGVVVVGHRGDGLTALDAPDLIHAAKMAGMPTLYLAEQPYLPNEPALTATLSAWLEAINAQTSGNA